MLVHNILGVACALTAASAHASLSTSHFSALQHYKDLAARAHDHSEFDKPSTSHLFARVEKNTSSAKDDTATKGKGDSAAKGKDKSKDQDTEHFDGTAQDIFCQPYLEKNGPPIPDKLQCNNAYDLNKPEDTIARFQELGIPVSGVQLNHHGYDTNATYPNSQIAVFACNCDAAANPKYTEFIGNWSGDTTKYNLKHGEAPFVTLPLFGHDVAKWNRIYVATACVIAAVTPQFWRQTHFSCGYYDLTHVTKENIKIVSDQNEAANNFALGDTQHKLVKYPPTGVFADPKAKCKECDDYNTQTGKYDYNASNKNFVSNGHKCINGADEANKGECNPESKLPPFPKDIPASMPADKYCQAYMAKDDHSNTPDPFYPVDNPRLAFQKFVALGGKIGGQRDVRTPDGNAQDVCLPTPNVVAMFEACDCHQLTYQKRVQLMGGSKMSKQQKKQQHRRAEEGTKGDAADPASTTTAASGSTEYIALAVFGKDLCWNDHYYASGCAIAKVNKAFYQQTKRTGAFYDFFNTSKDNLEIIQNFGSQQEVLALTPVGKGQGLEAADFPPKGADAMLSAAQKQCLADRKITCGTAAPSKSDKL